MQVVSELPKPDDSGSQTDLGESRVSLLHHCSSLFLSKCITVAGGSVWRPFD